MYVALFCSPSTSNEFDIGNARVSKTCDTFTDPDGKLLGSPVRALFKVHAHVGRHGSMTCAGAGAGLQSSSSKVLLSGQGDHVGNLGSKGIQTDISTVR